MTAAGLRATLGNVPVGGAFINELIDRIIPNQRMDRVARFAASVSRRLERAERSLEQLLAESTPEKVALFEDGARGASSATIDERIEQLASLVADGITAADRVAEDQRALVRMLSELTEGDIRSLMVATRRYGADEAWRKANGYHYVWEKRGLESVQVGDERNALVEVARDGRLIAMGLQRLDVLPPIPDGPQRPLETEIQITREGLELLRVLGLLKEGEE